MGNHIIQFKNIRKEFLNGKIIANDKVSFNIEKNTVHAIAGENGAGKSTLLSMLFGLYQPTSGEILVRDKKINYKSAADAMEDGLGMVQQHFQLVDIFTVAQNVTLGSEDSNFGFVKSKDTSVKIDEIAKKYNFNVKSNDKVNKLTVGQQQKVEILKVLYRDSEILIFDEPTSMLTPSEIDELINIILELKKEGKTIIIITHKLDEIKRVADKVSVLRKGTYIGTEKVSSITPHKLSKMMVGKDIEPPSLTKVDIGEEILKIENLSIKKKGSLKLNDFSVSIKAGEIVSIAGVEGNGQTELAESLSGINKRYTGSIYYKGTKIDKFSIFKRNKFIAHIPEDRHKYGMILDLLSYENVVTKDLEKFSKFGILKRKKIKKHADDIIKKFDVRGSDNGEAITRGLSGGNQQKLVVGRELSSSAELLLIFQATRGLDVGAINFIHNEIIKARTEKKAILLISYDLNEVISLSDRVLVLNAGRITGEVKGKDITKAKIGPLMSMGGNEKRDK